MRLVGTYLTACALVLAAGCDAPFAEVVLDNQYAPATGNVVYRATWLAVDFPVPLAPGGATDPQDTVAASTNTAWVLIAPGWDPTSDDPPGSLVVLASPDGFSVHLDETLHIPVDDDHFAGNCAVGSHLDQATADFITGRVFAALFAGAHYDAATCTTSGP
jgi:hypothetical protein